MSTVALALEHRIEDRLIGELVAAGHTVSARLATATEMIASIERMPPHIVLVQSTRRQLTAALVSACDGRGIHLVAVAAGDLERKHAAALGLYEVVDAAASWSDVEQTVRAAGAGPLRPAASGAGGGPGEESGSVITVWGPAGAPGRSTIAVGIAAELAAAGRAVLLIDADCYGGTIAPALGMLDESPGFAAACRLAAADALDNAELERLSQHYISGHGSFRVLTGISRPDRWPELSAERVRDTVRAARAWAQDIVIDTGFSIESDEEISSDLFAPRRNAATRTAIAEADRVVAVGAADPIGISRFLRAHVELLEIMETGALSVVMNRVRSSAVGVDAGGQVTSTLARLGGIASPALVPHDQNAADAAVLAGRTLRDTALNSPARVALERFVRAQLLPQEAQPARERGRRRRGRLLPRPA
ncbi:AAA family ATPase [Compostimonas suwonensis]|uniref:MinD-like ATPase involved in chromosome partitioning or flagellar assembly n=1 Tax=Compostimonas suwonensis TaxID=1048394 RepID=A0A2M9BUP9_9MICO|nr:regulator [Compostimonas suwonensis]PJJ61669.1 MinD-like ATPase involved in chromosome partitioning or flagellar assembly [Compostimonas suwonensis]